MTGRDAVGRGGGLRSRVNAWVEALGRGGLALDRAALPWALVPELLYGVIRAAGLKTSLTVCQSRAGCVSVYAALSGLPPLPGDVRPAVAVYPTRAPYGRPELPGDGEDDPGIRGGRGDGPETPGNCENYREVEKAVGYGLPPMQAVCQVCKSRKGCKYLAELEHARRARHAIMTSSRASYSDVAQEAGEREAVIIVCGHTLDVLSPTVDALLSPEAVRRGLTGIDEASYSCKVNAIIKGKGERESYFNRLGNLAYGLRDALDEGRAAVYDYPDAPVDEPRGWAAGLKGVFDWRRYSPGASLVRACVAAVAGRLGSLVVRPESGGVRIYAAFRPRSLTMPTLVLDPTLTPGRLRGAVGAEPFLIDATPPPARAVQVPIRVTGKMRPGAAAKLIRSRLIEGPGAPTGVLVTPELRDGLKALLSPEELSRVRLVCWGDDLAVRLAGCGLTLVFGNPPVHPAQVASRLIQSGRSAAAAEDGRWGPLPWDGELPWGRPYNVQRWGYRHPEWERARRELVRGRLAQALADVPGDSVVFSAERLGLFLDDFPLRADEGTVRLLGVLRELTPIFARREDGDGDNLLAKMGVNPSASSSPLLLAKMGDPGAGVTAELLSALTGVSSTTVKRKLASLAEKGFVIRVGWRGGWVASSLEAPYRGES